MGLIPTGARISSDEQSLIETAGQFAQEELLPLDRRCDRDESSVCEFLPRLAEMGLLSLCLPESIGGLGCRYPVYAALLHELSMWSPSTAVTVAVHNMVGRSLYRALSDSLHKEILSHFFREDSLAAFALSEAGAGSDSAGVKTTATEVPGGFRVDGEKMWITNGMNARWFLVLVRLHAGPPKESLAALLVDGNQSGIERTKITGKMGIRGSETAVIHFGGTFAPREFLVARPGEGLRIFLSSLNEGRIGIAAQATGIAEACLQEMVRYSREREQFGQPIAKFQAVSEMLASSATELDAARVLVWDAASRVGEQTPGRLACSEAKLWATEAANRIAYRAVQVHGGTGYVNECRVEQLYRDARVTTIYEGTSEVQRLVIGSELRRRYSRES